MARQGYGLATNVISGTEHLNKFFRKTPDSHVEQYLLNFTLLDVDSISALIKRHSQDPKAQLAQRMLAAHVTELVHGQQCSENAQLLASLLFDEKEAISSVDIINAARNDPIFTVLKRDELSDLVNLIPLIGLGSKASARKLLASGGIYINMIQQRSNKQIQSVDLIDDCILVLRIGKSNYRIMHLID